MREPSPSSFDLARKVLAENCRQTGTSNAPDAVLVIDSLRAPLVTLVGVYGFTTLVRRALTLASAEDPTLKSAAISVTDDGHLDGLERFVRVGRPEQDAAALVITAHLLGLLVSFIGEPLTHQLVRQLWPALSRDEHD